MTRILLLGYDPETVDFSNPAMPPGLDVAKIHAGVAHALGTMRGRGWTVDHMYLRPDETAGAALEGKLAASPYDCVVIGGGIRVHSGVAIFETLVNTVHRVAPGTPIAFNTRPEDSAEAAARWLQPG